MIFLLKFPDGTQGESISCFMNSCFVTYLIRSSPFLGRFFLISFTLNYNGVPVGLTFCSIKYPETYFTELSNNRVLVEIGFPTRKGLSKILGSRPTSLTTVH